MDSEASEAKALRLVVIEPPHGWQRLGVRDLWLHRDLMFFLAWRDIKVRYAQAYLGVAWALLQPLLMMVIFTIFIGRLTKLPLEGIPYSVFVFSGLVPWTYFANAVGGATESLVVSSNLVSKVYFPRLAVPVGALLAWVPDLIIASVMLLGLMLLFGVVPAATSLLIPLFGVFAILAAASISTWLSALNVTYRDVRYAVPFIIQLWLFATPVIYPASLVPERWQFLFGLNPMAGVVEGFRWALFGAESPMWGMMSVSAIVTLVLFIGGLYNFRRVEHRFADVI